MGPAARWWICLLLVSAGGCASGAVARPAPRAAGGPVEQAVVVRGTQLRAGTRLVASLRSPVSTDGSSPGDRFQADLVTPVIDRWGRRLLPRGAVLEGRVEALERGRGLRPARIQLSIDRLRQGGSVWPLCAAISWVEVEQILPAPRREPLASGVVAGVLFGGVLLAAPGALVGGFLGAAGAAGDILLERRAEGRLPSGTLLTVRLDAPISVAALRRWLRSAR